MWGQKHLVEVGVVDVRSGVLAEGIVLLLSVLLGLLLQRHLRDAAAAGVMKGVNGGHRHGSRPCTLPATRISMFMLLPHFGRWAGSSWTQV